MKRSVRSRGQSTVETALVALIFTTVLIFGIHFAEIGFVSLKVTEAANAGIFRQPFQHPLHNAPANTWGSQAFVASEGVIVNGRYSDFDGRTSRSGGAINTEVFTRATGMSVQCSNAQLNAFPPVGNSLTTSGSNAARCTAQAQVFAFNIPQRFFERSGKGFFAAPHLAGVETSGIPVCAFGTSSSGCQGQVSILLDDWGLTGPGESQDNPLATEGNPGFFKPAERMFTYFLRETRTPGKELATYVGAPADGSENKFFLSALSHPMQYTQNTPSHVNDVTKWETTPYTLDGKPTGYSKAYAVRQPCFLGLKCGAF